uniref:Uncharacterized protein n=1 Tax=Chenopodium quinoa TaxID=63459 RepID=A0A803LYM6_CHEQI
MSTPQGNETSVRITDNANSSIIDDNSSITYIKFDRGIRKKVLFWCNLVVFLVAAAICVASFTVPSLRKAPPSGIAMWQWSLLVTVLLCGPLLSKLLHYMVIFIDTKFELFGVAAAARENVVYYTVELIESAWVVLWFSIILVAWLWVVEDPSYLDVVLLMAKSSFHISKFFERVNDALMHQHVINRLTPRADTYDIGEPNLCQRMCDWKEKMPSLSDQVNQKNVSCWGMQKVINWFFDNENLTYKLVDGEDKKIESEDGAIEAAKYIYSLLAQSEDSMNKIKMYIKAKVQPKDQVSAVMCRLVDKQITEDDLMELMVKAFKYRETLASALKANKKLFEALNKFTEALLVFLIFALWLMMLRVETRKFIIVIGTAIVGSAVIIGDTCKKLLDCLLFVFVVHPFDIGGGEQAEQHCNRATGKLFHGLVTIKRIKILTTIALTLDNEIRYYPNTELAVKCISNYTRSREMGDFVVFTPETGASIEDIEHKIERSIDDPKIKVLFGSAILV